MIMNLITGWFLMFSVISSFQPCPICSDMVVKDMVNHITMQHGYLFRVPSRPSHSCCSLNFWNSDNWFTEMYFVGLVRSFPWSFLTFEPCRIVAGCVDLLFQAAKPYLCWAGTYVKLICRCFLVVDRGRATTILPQIFQLILSCHRLGLASQHQMQRKHQNQLFPFQMTLPQ